LRRLTRNQRLVLETIRRADRPVGAYEILRELQTSGFRSPVQVYRATEKLIASGAIHRVEKLNAFVPCSHPYLHLHGHLLTVLAICGRCGKVTELQGGAVEREISQLAGRANLTVTDGIVEINVLCNRCMGAAGQEKRST
jgi:Fur family zinc uptake transcriptional regulator